jgi:hypothetical protein
MTMTPEMGTIRAAVVGTGFIPVRHAPGWSVPRAMPTEDAAGLLLRLEGGARAVCALSQVSAGRKNFDDLATVLQEA